MAGRVRVGTGLLVAALLGAGPASARQVADVSLPEQQSVEGRELSLVRMALKEKFFFDLYVWGLYLEDKVQSSDEAIASRGHKRLQFMMKRALSREQLVSGIRQTLGASPAMQEAGMREGLDRMIVALSEVQPGDSLIISYVAGEGTYVSGKVRGVAFIPGKAFADALFAAWLEANPLFAT